MGVDDHDGSRQEMRVAQKEAVGFPEVGAAIVGQKRDVVNLGLFRKAFLREGGVDAHGDEFDHLVQTMILFAQLMCLLLADLGVEGGDDADDPDLSCPGRVGDVDQSEIPVGQFHVAQVIPDFDSSAGQH